MRTRLDLAKHLLDQAYRVAADNVANVTLDEALFSPPGGYRSILGILKHIAAWSHVYHSYVFDPEPKHWNETNWPRGLRDTVVSTRDYLDEIIQWFEQSHQLWMHSLAELPEADIDRPRPLHWGDSAPLFDIIVMIANHHVYHAGEINQLLSIYRGEAWEEGEEVEENHLSTAGHRVRPPWQA